MIAAIAADKGGGRSSVNDQNSIKRAICDAIARISRQEDLWIQEAEVEFATVNDTIEYDLDTLTDLVNGRKIIGFEGEYLYFIEQNATTSVWERINDICRIHPDNMDGELLGGPLYGNPPRYWSVFGDKLRFYPGTDDATHRIRGRAKTQPGTPTYSEISGTWAFLWSDGTASDVADTNEWFALDGGYQMVKAYAEYLLCNGYWSGSSPANDAQQALEAYGQHRAALVSFGQRRSGPTQIEPYSFGIGQW
jgi:hypothetical protein